jgi:hypothetical protein
MNNKERAEEFLEALTDLCQEFGFEITGEGNSPLLYDIMSGKYIGGFGTSFLSSTYKLYDDMEDEE